MTSRARSISASRRQILLFLSFSDSDLGAAAAAWQAMGADRPTLRLASLARLRHPMSVDMYVEQVIAHARCVVVRLLGGLDYWQYGARGDRRRLSRPRDPARDGARRRARRYPVGRTLHRAGGVGCEAGCVSAPWWASEPDAGIAAGGASGGCGRAAHGTARGIAFRRHLRSPRPREPWCERRNCDAGTGGHRVLPLTPAGR